MPGEGSPHHIREALHWQDLGQASAVVQKPRASQKKTQRRTMARPCHRVQDILDAGVSPSAPECVSPRRVGLPRPRWAALAASAARRRARPWLSVSRTVHRNPGICSCLAGCAATPGSATASATSPGAPATLSAQAPGRRSRGSGTHLGAWAAGPAASGPSTHSPAEPRAPRRLPAQFREPQPPPPRLLLAK